MLTSEFKPWHVPVFLVKYAYLTATRRPVLVHFEVTMRCNARCGFCDYWKTDPSAKASELASFADAARFFNALSSRRGLHFHTVIASGNQAVLSAADYLSFLAADEDVRSVALYLEDDGGPGLCDALAACADGGVNVAVLKVDPAQHALDPGERLAGEVASENDGDAPNDSAGRNMLILCHPATAPARQVKIYRAGWLMRRPVIILKHSRRWWKTTPSPLSWAAFV